MLDKSKIRLLKMNEYDWVAAETAEQANEWYLSEFGLGLEENPLEEIEEESLDKVFLSDYDDLNEDEIKMCFKQREISGKVYVEIPFSYTLGRMENVTEPFIAGSTEW